MSVVRWFIESDSTPNTQIYPTWSNQTSSERVNDGVYFRDKIDGELRVGAEDYALIKEVPDCELITVYLEELCGETWTERIRGSFTTYDINWNETLCRASVSPKISDAYVCLFDSWDISKVISGAGSVVVARPFGGTYEGGYGCCSECIPNGDPIPTDPVCSVPANYCFDHNTTELENDGPLCQYLTTSCFHRITGTGTALTPPPYGTGWTLLSGTTWWRCPDVVDTSYGPLDQGRWLSDVLEYLADNLQCPLTVRSHFFGINATHDAPPSNDAYTFADTYCQALQVHQKSDVKRPDSTNPAQSFVWKMTLKKLLEDFEGLFQVFFKVDGTDLIIEHSTYFESVEWLDVSNRNLTISYEKKDNGAPTKELFKFVDSEATFEVPFAAQPITYGNCGEGTKETKLNYFSNDVSYIRATDNQEEIADSNFVLICTELIGSYNAIVENNEPMGWERLHDALHRDRRYFIDGTMNGTAETFNSVRRTRKLEPFDVTLCCDDTINPTGYVTTAIGPATVDKITRNYAKDKVTIEANV